MRGLAITIFIFMFTMGLTIMNEVNESYSIEECGNPITCPLIPFRETSYLNLSQYQVEEMEGNVDTWGLVKPPTQSGGIGGFLDTGFMLIAAGRATWDAIINATIGFPWFIHSLMPSAPMGLKIGLSAIVMVNNLLLLIAVVRGVKLMVRG